MADTYLMYLRKSRADGDHETVEEVLAKHYKILQDHAVATIGRLIPEDKIYQEVVSGETIQDRPEMKKLLDRIQAEEITGVFVVDPQRLSRGDLSDCGTIIRAFRYTNTLVITSSKTYDLNDKFDRKFFEMELMRGGDYLEYVKEIMMRGRIASVKNGNFIGNTAPYGYMKIKDGKNFTLAPDPNEANVLKLIYELWVNEGLGCVRIANRLNSMNIKPRKAELWNHNSLQRMLKNPVYIGKICWNRRKRVKKYENGNIVSSRPINKDDDILMIDGRHEPLISKEMFYASLDRFGKLPKNKAKTGLKNPFAGILHCSCGRAMIYQPSNKCAARLHCAYQMHCGNRSATYEEVEHEVLRALKELTADVKEYIDGNNTNSSDANKVIISALTKELNELEAQQNKLYELLEKGIYDSDLFLSRNKILAERRQQLEEGIAEAHSMEQSQQDYESRYVALLDAISALENESLSAEAKNQLLRAVIKDITYSRLTTKRTKWSHVPFTLDISLL